MCTTRQRANTGGRPGGTYADNRHLVVEVMSDSPAENAGIEAGDTILLVDGTPAGPTHRALRDRLRGPAGSRVVLTIQREDREEPWEYTLVRGWVRIPALRSELLSPTIPTSNSTACRGAHRDIERLWRAQTKVSA